jgi:putative ABC transport system substrate-binding protein
MRRREFITLLGGAVVVWPLAGIAQQRKVPTIGVLVVESPGSEQFWQLFQKVMRELSYVEGQSIRYEFRSDQGQPSRLPKLAAELVQLKVDLIVTWFTPAAQAAKQATREIPIVMALAGDPIGTGLVESLNRPGGNITGVSFASNISESKRLGLLHAMIPAVTTIGVLMNPDNASAETQTRDLNAAARALGLKLEIANARDEGDFEHAFASLVERGARGLDVASDVVLNRRIEKLAVLAARYGLPAIYAPNVDARASAAAGGLMSYGASTGQAFHQAGIYIGRILHGEKPGDLPVMLPTNFQLAINLKAAKALGIEVPPTLSAIADEVIE